jgi:alpha-beta hydrolase superfamily lysophospholipase
MLSSVPRRGFALSRRSLLLGAGGLLAGCVAESAPPGLRTASPEWGDDSFIMSDGARLPVRVWHTEGKPRVVILALHGFNDSRDAWEIPAPDFTAAGMAIYAPDQRGFGEAPGRGLWPGGEALTDDAAEMVAILRRRHPGLPLVLMGESMGGAVLMRLATRPNAPNVRGYVLVAPAVWGRAEMNIFERGGLWLAATLTPGMEISRPPPPIKVRASDNLDALIRLSRDPLTVRSTRMDTLYGLVDLMDAALAAAAYFRAPGLFMYGEHDELVPRQATLATWRALPPGPHRLAFYPHGWHLLMRDLDRAVPIGDAIAWIDNPSRARLPSGADELAQQWMNEAVA